MARNKSYFAPLVTLPVIIDRKGQYKTRGGEVVTIDQVSRDHDFRCLGEYRGHVREGWHRSGRLYANLQSDNDIVSAA